MHLGLGIKNPEEEIIVLGAVKAQSNSTNLVSESRPHHYKVGQVIHIQKQLWRPSRLKQRQ